MLEICHREQKNPHVMRHRTTEQWTGKAGSGEWFPTGALQMAQLFSERNNLPGVLTCLSSKSVRFPGQRGNTVTV